MSYEDMIIGKGFRHAGICNCAGGRTQKYKKDSFTVYVNKAGNIFRIKEGKQVIVTYTQLQRLEKSLNQILNVAVEEKV
jgi:hypothetical protein